MSLTKVPRDVTKNKGGGEKKKYFHRDGRKCNTSRDVIKYVEQLIS